MHATLIATKLCRGWTLCVPIIAGSSLADRLGQKFSTTYLSLARHELGLYADAVGDEGDEVSEFERDRYLEHI